MGRAEGWAECRRGERSSAEQGKDRADPIRGDLEDGSFSAVGLCWGKKFFSACGVNSQGKKQNQG
jgi:hypothetical protein